ncbi:Malate dehydrogenase protein [Thalictrum thalictroides]|uniref:malate dehydrogenase n=1 Tax=Thalictrum thalictroides TaxID=46969 RepID=A0A7J6VBL3_THATH|nr:Malate dehydrogenase protein [Thalictrum thalictroides]
MRASMLRSIETVLKRTSSSLSQSPSPSPSHLIRRSFASESSPDRKITALGAAGGIGQPLASLMKLNPLVSKLSLHDIAGIPGVAADVSHINTRSEVLITFGV